MCTALIDPAHYSLMQCSDAVSDVSDWGREGGAVGAVGAVGTRFETMLACTPHGYSLPMYLNAFEYVNGLHLLVSPPHMPLCQWFAPTSITTAHAIISVLRLPPVESVGVQSHEFGNHRYSSGSKGADDEGKRLSCRIIWLNNKLILDVLLECI
jgi:hypothetical protein